MPEIKLKPCPFCGRDATTRITTKTYVIHGEKKECISFSVECLACRIGMHSSIETNDSFEEAEKAMQRAVNYWNRRTDNETD